MLQAAVLYVLVSHADVPFGQDQDSYLDAAQVIRDGGVWFDGQRNPLLSAVLSQVTTAGEAGVHQARLLVAAGTVALTLLQMLMAHRLWGTGAACLWGFLTGFCATTLDHGAMIMVEGWLVGFAGMALLTLVDSCRTDRGWWRPGLWLGLALLAKGTAPVLVAAVVIGLVVAGEVRGLAVLVATTTVVFMPFLVYRWQVFGDPFHQVSHGLSWLDSYHPHQLEGIGFSEFVATHGLGGLVARLADHAVPVLGTAVDALVPLAPGSGSTRLILALAVAVPLFLSRGRRAAPVDRRLVGVVVATTGIWWAFCAWMAPVADVRRYWLPLAPFVALVVIGLWRRAAADRTWWTGGVPVGVVVLLLVAARAPRPEVIRRDFLADPSLSWKEDPRYTAYRGIREALEKDGWQPGDRVLYGPGDNLPRSWLWPLDREHLVWGAREDAGEVRRLFARCRYWILDRSTVERNGDIFRRLASSPDAGAFPRISRIARIGIDGDNPVEIWKNPLAGGER